MKQLIFGLITIFILSGCSAAEVLYPAPDPEAQNPPQVAEKLPVPQNIKDHGPAPELNNPVWLNTEAPLKLAELRGQVVLLDMWTFGCYNCRNVIPHLREWYDKYADEGLVVIGNHYPEFSHERELTNVETAVQDLEITYPIAIDNEGETWRAYNNHYWPTLYLIDKQGNIRFVHIGEGAYVETQSVIEYLLSEPYN